MNRTICIILSLLLALSVFTACADTNTPASGDTLATGDSGGAIVRLVGDKYYITGIHTGRTNSYAVFSKIDNILNDLGVTLY